MKEKLIEKLKTIREKFASLDWWETVLVEMIRYIFCTLVGCFAGFVVGVLTDRKNMLNKSFTISEDMNFSKGDEIGYAYDEETGEYGFWHLPKSKD